MLARPRARSSATGARSASCASESSCSSAGSTGWKINPDGGFSFLGVQFTGGERVARVRLTLGDMSVLAHGQFSDLRNDLVALDDFIYAEPAAVPEPASWALLAMGAAALARGRRRR